MVGKREGCILVTSYEASAMAPRVMVSVEM